MFKLTVGRNNTHYVVYEHRIILGDGSEKIAYIGMCQHSELFEYPDAKRNSEWVKFFTTGTLFKVNVLHIVKSVEEAEGLLTFETLCRPLMPYCNARGHPVTTAQIIKCSNGITYPSANAAARSLGISQPALSRHLRGKSGYRSIKGLTFTYITE